MSQNHAPTAQLQMQEPPSYLRPCKITHVMALQSEPGTATLDGVLWAAHVDEQVAADTAQAPLEVQHRLEQELRAHRARLGVAPGRRAELAGVKAVQGHHLHAMNIQGHCEAHVQSLWCCERHAEHALMHLPRWRAACARAGLPRGRWGCR